MLGSLMTLHFQGLQACDTDGSQFSPKDWPQEVLDEINIDRDTGEFKRDEEPAYDFKEQLLKEMRGEEE